LTKRNEITRESRNYDKEIRMQITIISFYLPIVLLVCYTV